MQSDRRPIKKDLVLLGGGHSHVFVLKGLGMKPEPGVRVTLVCRDIHTPYSGMLPGLVAGHYTYDETHIDLRKLAAFAGVRFIHDEAVEVDPENRRVLFASRPSLGYDVLSINTGSTPNVNAPGAARFATPVKPISRFLPFWEGVLERSRRRKRSKIGVVGGGAGGVELMLAARYRLENEGAPASFYLFTGGGEPLEDSHSRWMQKSFRRRLETMEDVSIARRRVQEVEADGVVDEGGERWTLDEVLWTTQASAPAWLAASGFETDERGFIAVGDDLQSVSHPGVFAAGDVAAVVKHPRPKAGVFAVRQGPPLTANLRRALAGEPTRTFRPQRDFLTLISTGSRYAYGQKWGLVFSGAWVWRWKDHIDRKFMAKFGDDLPWMEPDEDEPPMICKGCGGKVGPGALDEALSRLPAFERDDAAVVEVPAGKTLVQSVDFLTAIVDDAYLFGKIAANHCLGDLYAMGAEPESALATVTAPHATPEKTADLLAELLTGVDETLRAAGARLVGGHSCECAELAAGLAVNGFAEADRLVRKGGARPGDRLILTQPLGVGALFAGEMHGAAKGRWIDAAIERMLVSQREASRIFVRHQARAMTDVTGFGLAGHLLEMLDASGAGADLQLGAVPLLEGAAEVVGRGVASTLAPENRRAAARMDAPGSVLERPEAALLFDPQTAGGLLAAVPAERAAECLEALRAAGYDQAAEIGVVREAEDAAIRLKT